MTTTIRNVSPDARYLPALDLMIDPGEQFDVDDPQLAEKLLEQPANWAPVEPTPDPDPDPVEED